MLVTLAMITGAEMQKILASPICLNCNHREILHNHDYEQGTQCNVCDCTDQILEGDFSPWHPSGMFKSIADYTNAYVTQRMIAMAEKDLHLGQGGANDA